MIQGWLITISFVCITAVIYAADLGLRKLRGRSPLSHHRPSARQDPATPKRELGMEAIDLDLIDKVNKENRRLAKRNRRYRR